MLASPAVTGQTSTWLRSEGSSRLYAAIVGYHVLDGSWGPFAVLFLAPDRTFLGFLAGTSVGARVYNVAHTYVGPAGSRHRSCRGAFVVLPDCLDRGHAHRVRPYLRVWLKYPSAFTDTHLGSKGRPVNVDPEERT